jgi:hypothetical protein
VSDFGFRVSDFGFRAACGAVLLTSSCCEYVVQGYSPALVEHALLRAGWMPRAAADAPFPGVCVCVRARARVHACVRLWYRCCALGLARLLCGRPRGAVNEDPFPGVAACLRAVVNQDPGPLHWAAGCGLLAAGCGLRAAGCGLRAAGCGLLAAGCSLVGDRCRGSPPQYFHELIALIAVATLRPPPPSPPRYLEGASGCLFRGGWALSWRHERERPRECRTGAGGRRRGVGGREWGRVRCWQGVHPARGWQRRSGWRGRGGRGGRRGDGGRGAAGDGAAGAALEPSESQREPQRP